MARVGTYLNFSSNTEQAFNFYKLVFKIEFIAPGVQRMGNIVPQEGMPPMPML